ncbi:MAG: NHL repeat-containing protein [Georgfuchsia sp.]
MLGSHSFSIIERKWIFVLNMLFAAVILAGCGGGGGGGGGDGGQGDTNSTPTASPRAFAIDVAISNLVRNGFDAPFKLTGSFSNSIQAKTYSVTGQGTLSWVSAITAKFEGVSVLDASGVMNGSETVAGQTISVLSTAHQYFRSDNFYPVGQIDDSNNYYVVTSFSGWPSGAKVGDSGSLGTVTIYADYTKQLKYGDQQWNYTIEPDSADTAIFAWTTAETDTDGYQSIQTDRYRITFTGGITFISTSFSDSDAGSLTVTATSVQTPGKTPALAPWVLPRTVGGSITGLTGIGLTLESNSQTLSVSANASYFIFTSILATGTAYNVTVVNQPFGLNCTVSNGTGTMGTEGVQDVAVTCIPPPQGLGGSIVGLNSNGLVLVNGTDSVSPQANNVSFEFANSVAYGTTYNVIVQTQPFGQSCSVSNGSGTGGSAPITMTVTCVSTPPMTASTFAGNGQYGSTDGPGATASFFFPRGIAVDSVGNVYVGEPVKIRKITPAGIVSTLAGSGQIGSTDGSGSSASFNGVDGLAVDSSGNLYVADAGNNLIRKITADGNVSTFAGSGQTGAANGPSTAASFNVPRGIAVDGAGNVYVADAGNNLIRKIASDGNVSTFAGSGQTGAANGPSATASFNYPTGIAVDGTGNVYVADAGNKMIRKVMPDGNVATLAGTGQLGATNGPGDTASFGQSLGVAVDSAGTVYVADSNNNRIRKISVAGLVTTLAGTGETGATNGPDNAATFWQPYSVSLDSAGNVYVVDASNVLIRKISAQ